MLGNGFDLGGKLAVVTGGASGLGFAAAERLVAAGAKVVLVGRDFSRLDAAAARMGGGVSVWPADVSDAEQLRALFDGLDQVDVLVTCAGWTLAGQIEEISLARVRELLDARVLGQLAAVHFAVPRMASGGVIVLNSGVADRVGLAVYSAGAVVDGAVNALTRQLAVELGPRRIRVNAVSPGMIADTEQVTRHRLEKVFRMLLPRVPLGRLGRAADVADAIHFLVTTTYVTGHVLEVDGGWSVS